MATTQPRNTPQMGAGVIPQRLHLKVKTNVKINQGALVALDAAGYAIAAATATTLIAVGRAEESVDNTGGADGAKLVNVTPGVFKFANSGSDAVVQAGTLKDCFIVDDETVAATNGTNTRSRAGKVIQLDADGVWVLVAPGV